MPEDGPTGDEPKADEPATDASNTTGDEPKADEPTTDQSKPSEAVVGGSVGPSVDVIGSRPTPLDQFISNDSQDSNLRDAIDNFHKSGGRKVGSFIGCLSILDDAIATMDSTAMSPGCNETSNEMQDREKHRRKRDRCVMIEATIPGSQGFTAGDDGADDKFMDNVAREEAVKLREIHANNADDDGEPGSDEPTDAATDKPADDAADKPADDAADTPADIPADTPAADQAKEEGTDDGKEGSSPDRLEDEKEEAKPAVKSRFEEIPEIPEMPVLDVLNDVFAQLEERECELLQLENTFSTMQQGQPATRGAEDALEEAEVDETDKPADTPAETPADTPADKPADTSADTSAQAGDGAAAQADAEDEEDDYGADDEEADDEVG